ncbi:MAG: hypothetical protein JW882_06105 [Deltaproteobacteria bacterium]|nr:hypothetical protein [Deltaproteobacteria bacterium]
MGVFDIDIFSEDVDSVENPLAENFRVLLEEVAEQYGCRLLSFEIHKGTVSFSFDSDKLTADIINILSKKEGKASSNQE